METGRAAGLPINGRSVGKPGPQFKTQKHVKQITDAQELCWLVLLAGAATILCLRSAFKSLFNLN